MTFEVLFPWPCGSALNALLIMSVGAAANQKGINYSEFMFPGGTPQRPLFFTNRWKIT